MFADPRGACIVCIRGYPDQVPRGERAVGSQEEDTPRTRHRRNAEGDAATGPQPARAPDRRCLGPPPHRRRDPADARLHPARRSGRPVGCSDVDLRVRPVGLLRTDRADRHRGGDGGHHAACRLREAGSGARHPVLRLHGALPPHDRHGLVGGERRIDNVHGACVRVDKDCTAVVRGRIVKERA